MIILSLTVYQVVEIELHVHFSNQFIKPFAGYFLFQVCRGHSSIASPFFHLSLSLGNGWALER